MISSLRHCRSESSLNQLLMDDKQETRMIIPSFDFPKSELEKVKGIKDFESRAACFLINKNPDEQTIFLSGKSLQPEVVGYYLNLDGQPRDFKARVQSTWVLSPRLNRDDESLCTSILKDRPLISFLGDLKSSENHILNYMSSPGMDQLSATLEVKAINSPKESAYWGTKAGSREVFEEAGILFPAGVPGKFKDMDLRDERGYILSLDGIVEAMARHLEASGKEFITSWLIKLNQGIAGMGNADLDLVNAKPGMAGVELRAALKQDFLNHLGASIPNFDRQGFLENAADIGMIAEQFIKDEMAVSPSVQVYIDPDGAVEVLSTHDQILDGQKFLGSRFPAQGVFQNDLHSYGQLIGDVLAKKGVRGYFGVDFLAVGGPENPQLFAIEINLRQTGTTSPYMTAKRLLKGPFVGDGIESLDGQKRVYFSTDHLQAEAFKDLRPEQVIAAIKKSPIHWNPATSKGVVFHLFDKLASEGEIGLTAIGENHREADALYEQAGAFLTELAAKPADHR